MEEQLPGRDFLVTRKRALPLTTYSGRLPKNCARGVVLPYWSAISFVMVTRGIYI